MIYSKDLMYQIDVWSEIARKYDDHSHLKGLTYHKQEFIGTITVLLTDNIQEVREKIRQMIPNPPAQIDLHIIRMQAIKSGPLSLSMEPIPPYSVLHSNTCHSVKYIIDNTSMEYDYVKNKELREWFSLKPLERVIFKAVDYK
jgi:hypothetical protein